MGPRTRSFLLSWLVMLGTVAGAGADDGKFKVYTIDVGTGLGVYIELPGPEAQKRPFRIVYDTGKGASEGTDNDLVSFLTSAKIGLQPANGDFQGDVIDYFVLSHPHEDHFNGAKPLFDMFEVRNVIESKQIKGAKYLSRFKAPAVNEIKKLQAAGVDAHYYVVGLPYPNGFDQPRDGAAYDEYAIAAANLPDFMKQAVDPRRFSGKVTFPFGPDQVSQPVDWPILSLLAGTEKALKLIDADHRDGSLKVDVIPVGTHFDLGRKGGFTVIHGDTIAAFDPGKVEKQTYAAAFPYYRESDLNDGSVTLHVELGAASVLIPGDTEGRLAKPETMVRLTDVFGSRDENDSYTPEDISSWLREDRPEAERLPILDMARPYVVSSFDIGRLAYYGYVTFDDITPSPLEVTAGKKALGLPAREYVSPEDIDPEVISWEKRNELQREHLHPRWKERLFSLYENLKLNRQKLDALRTRFKGWTKGAKPRLKYKAKEKDFMLDWENPVWSVVNLVQLTEQVYYVDPGLAQIFAGMILRSDLFLEYMSPKEPEKRALRGEKHMIHVADQIKAESGRDVLKADVLFFGHHGSFTSTSIGFLQRVDPNVGIISADDKSYSGSTLPDFSALFWNLNSRHPKARAILHSIFFHADVLASKRGEEMPDDVMKDRFSPSASRVFRARGRWPIPLWRTDWNDDLVDRNTLVDNIEIVTDGTKPIWDWSRTRGRDEEGKNTFAAAVTAGLSQSPERYPYWSLELITARTENAGRIVPDDPSGEISTFGVDTRFESAPEPELQNEAAFRSADFGEEYEAEDWVLREE